MPVSVFHVVGAMRRKLDLLDHLEHCFGLDDLKLLLADCTVAMAAAMRGALVQSCISCTHTQGFEG